MNNSNLKIPNVDNVKVKFLRKNGYNNILEWLDNDNNVYIGRRGIVFIDKERFPKISSPFCNPFKVGKDGLRAEVIEKYRIYIRELLDKDRTLKDGLNNMKGKNLGCWCHPEPCHGDVLLELINSIQ